MGAMHTPGRTDLPPLLSALALSVETVGSRVTCDPPPVGTDADILVLIEDGRLNEARGTLADEGFAQDGSQVADEVNYIDAADRFESFKRGDLNIILTASAEFFRRFMAASACAKRLNLLAKADRIALFQAVLYGNTVSDEAWLVPDEAAIAAATGSAE